MRLHFGPVRVGLDEAVIVFVVGYRSLEACLSHLRMLGQKRLVVRFCPPNRRGLQRIEFPSEASMAISQLQPKDVQAKAKEPGSPEIREPVHLFDLVVNQPTNFERDNLVSCAPSEVKYGTPHRVVLDPPRGPYWR